MTQAAAEKPPASGLTAVCDKCKQERPKLGGVQRTPSSWHCAKCWIGFRINRKNR